MNATREATLHASDIWFDAGHFLAELSRRVAWQTASQEVDRRPTLSGYLTDEMGPALTAMGFTWRVVSNPTSNDAPPFLIGERIEDVTLRTALLYGHGDVVRGYDAQWRSGLSPWQTVVEGDRIYGRGTADNKGQHTVVLAALARVLHARGRLGFNVKVLLETGEEVGSPGLHALCEREKAALAADVLIASDGPRLAADRPTLFLGSRGALNFDLVVDLREGAHHSGNWGGLLANPGTILANAIATMVDARGRILVDGLQPPPIPATVRAALAGLSPGEPTGPAIDIDWGEPELTPAERVFAWNSLEVLAATTGNPQQPVNAIPPRARAHMQIRFVVGSRCDDFIAIVRAHLAAHGFTQVTVEPAGGEMMRATRLDPADPWVEWAVQSITRTVGCAPVVLPNLGGSLPNDCFADVLGLPTLWIPHSYSACSQHAPNEHLLVSVAREGLRIMTGLFWDLGEQGSSPGVAICRAGTTIKKQ